MIRKLALATGIAVMAFALSPQAASATTVGPRSLQLGTAVSGGSLVQQVQFRYCRRVIRRCAWRWGWGSWRFRRCVRARGC